MRKNSTKNQRINSEVRRELSEIIRSEVKDPRIHPMTSVVTTEVAPDLKTCKVYISVLGDEEALADTVQGLKNAEGYIRRTLARNLNLRNTPELRFLADHSIRYGVEMAERIDTLMAAERREDGGPVASDDVSGDGGSLAALDDVSDGGGSLAALDDMSDGGGSLSAADGVRGGDGSLLAADGGEGAGAPAAAYDHMASENGGEDRGGADGGPVSSNGTVEGPALESVAGAQEAETPHMASASDSVDGEGAV